MTQGYKTFNDGERLDAADVNAYLMSQTVQRVATSTRNPSPVQGQLCYTIDKDRLEVYDGSEWIRIAHGTAEGRTYVHVSRDANQSIASGGLADISWDTENDDADGFIAVTGTTLTVPTGLAGIYSITYRQVLASIPSGDHLARLTANGLVYDQHAPGGAASGTLTLSITVPLSAGATVKASAYQSSGGAINMTGNLFLTRVCR